MSVEAVKFKQLWKGECECYELKYVEASHDQYEDHMRKGASIYGEPLPCLQCRKATVLLAPHLVKHCRMSTSSRCPIEFGPDVVDMSFE